MSRYYAECTLPSLHDLAFTLYTNLDSVFALLDEVGIAYHDCSDEAYHLVVEVRLGDMDDYTQIERMLKDAARVENLLVGVVVGDI